MSESSKRFIAGAICPQCQLIDKIVVYQQDHQAYCQCVRCGYSQQQDLSVKNDKPLTPLKKSTSTATEQTIRLLRPMKKK